MKLVSYMLKKNLGTFIFSLFFFVLVFSLTDLFLNIWNYISNNVPAKTVINIMIYFLPKTVWYSVPVAMLFATVYMLSDLYAKNELLAVFASGVSLFKFTVPLLIISAFMSYGLFIFEDKVVVNSYAKKVALQNEVLNKTKSLDNLDLVVISEGGKIIYKADSYEDKTKKLQNVFILFRNKNKSYDTLLQADNAVWDYDHWELSNAFCYQKTNDGFTLQKPDYDHLFRLVEPPETFQNDVISVEEVSVEQAKNYISLRQKAGLPVYEAKAEYYKKFAFPLIVFVVTLLAIGLSGKTRKNVLIVSLALSIAAVVIFYVLQMITMLMAKFGAIPPLLGEWFPVFLFIFISCTLLRFART